MGKRKLETDYTARSIFLSNIFLSFSGSVIHLALSAFTNSII